jgi:hypothetical protein
VTMVIGRAQLKCSIVVGYGDNGKKWSRVISSDR